MEERAFLKRVVSTNSHVERRELIECTDGLGGLRAGVYRSSREQLYDWTDDNSWSVTLILNVRLLLILQSRFGTGRRLVSVMLRRRR
jgi:hypothetical protein